MKRFFIEKSMLADPAPFISGSDANHMKNVLRLKLADDIVLFDGEGSEHEAKIRAFSARGVEVSVIGRFASGGESPARIIVGQAFLKDRKMDLLVRQLTELGIAKWIPFVSERSVPQLNEKRLAGRVERWKRIARESLKQCRRSHIPEMETGVSFEDLLHMERECDLKIIFWEKETASLRPARLNEPCRTIFVMMGPEGGFTPKEIKHARACGWVTASLGPRILRAETATIAACTLIQFFFGDL